jgi:hypothetical protein
VVPAYTRGPLIIHVPQAFDRNERLNSRASVTHDPAYTDDDDDTAPPSRRQAAPPVRTTPRWTPQPRAVRHIDMSKPKTAPKAELKPEPPVPQPPSPRRAVLNAPPRLPEITADTPPPGYSPPAAPPRDNGYGNTY